MRHLVEDHLGAELVERAVLAAAREVLVAEGHAPGVLHRAHVVLRHEQLVVLPERVGVAELLLEEAEALLGDLPQLVGVEVLDQRLAAVEPHRDLAVRALVGLVHRVVLAGDQGGDVGRHRLGLGEPPDLLALAAVLGLGGRGVGGDRPAGRRGDRERVRRLEVGLLEGGVDPAGVGHLELRVEVDPVVGRVDEAVQPLTRAGVGAVGLDHEGVVGGQAAQRDPAVGVRRGVDGLAVERDLVDGRAHEVGEGRCTGLSAAEDDRRGGAERGVARREVQVDGVRRDVQEGGAGCGLVPSEVGSRHAVILPPG